MAHSEIYPNGDTVNKFFKVNSVEKMSQKFGNLSTKAFLNGAEKVEQRIIRGNETCPKCDSGLRFDLCCGALKGTQT